MHNKQKTRQKKTMLHVRRFLVSRRKINNDILLILKQHNNDY